MATLDELIVKITADARGLSSGISSSQSRLKGFDSRTKNILKNTGSYFDKLKKKVSTSFNGLSNLKSKLSSFSSAIKSQLSSLQNSFAGVSAKAHQLKGAFGESFAKSASLTGGVEKLGTALGAILNPATLAIGAITGLSVAATGSVASFAKYESSLIRLQAYSGESVQAMAGLKSEIEQVTASSGQFAITKVSGAMEELVKSGVNASDSLSLIKVSMDAAIASGEDLVSVNSNILDALAQFKLGIGEAERVADVFANTANITKLDVSDISKSMRNVGAVAQQFGINVESAAAAVGVLGENGQVGSRAGEQLKIIMRNLYAPMGQAKEAMDRLGVSAYDMATGKARPLRDILIDVREKLEEMSPAQRNQTATLISGGEAMASFSILTREADQRLQEFEESNNNATGANRRMADLMNRGLSKAWTNFGNQLDLAIKFMGAAINKGQWLERVIKNVADAFQRFNQAAASDGRFEGIADKVKKDNKAIIKAERLRAQDGLKRVKGKYVPIQKEFSEEQKDIQKRAEVERSKKKLFPNRPLLATANREKAALEAENRKREKAAIAANKRLFKIRGGSLPAEDQKSADELLSRASLSTPISTGLSDSTKNNTNNKKNTNTQNKPTYTPKAPSKIDTAAKQAEQQRKQNAQTLISLKAQNAEKLRGLSTQKELSELEKITNEALFQGITKKTQANNLDLEKLKNEKDLISAKLSAKQISEQEAQRQTLILDNKINQLNTDNQLLANKKAMVQAESQRVAIDIQRKNALDNINAKYDQQITKYQSIAGSEAIIKQLQEGKKIALQETNIKYDQQLSKVQEVLRNLGLTKEEIKKISEATIQSTNDLAQASQTTKQGIEGITQAGDQMGQSLGDAITGFIKNGEFDLKQFASSILDTFLNIAGQIASTSLGGGGGGSGGIISSLVGGLFGGAFATGGVAQSGKVSLVGERGPELIMPQRNSRIFSNRDSIDILGGSQASTPSPIININVSAVDEQGVREFFARPESRQMVSQFAVGAVQAESNRRLQRSSME